MSGFTSPKWLNNEFLETALRAGDEDPFVSVTSSSIEAATAGGDNYMSEMYRVTVQLERRGRKEERSIIVKAEPKTKLTLKIVSEGNLFVKETKLFRDVNPALFNLMEEIAPGEYQPFGAKYLYSCEGQPANAIVLEDLKKQGFTMAERTFGLDMNHCLLVVRNLARFHALSLVLHERNPEIFKPFTRTIFCGEMRNTIETFFTSILRKLAKEVKTWPNSCEKLADKIDSIADKAVDYWIEAVTTDDEDFNVLIHGDLWVNNILFRYSEVTGKVQDLRFVDYQLTYWTSPAVDLQYFLNSSPAIELTDKLHILVEEYHETLGQILDLFGRQSLQPSLQHLYDQLQKKGTFGALTGITIRSLVQADRKNIPNFDECLENEEGIHFSDIYKQTMEKLLPLYEQKGWL